MKLISRHKSILIIMLFVAILIGIRLLWMNYLSTLEYVDHYSIEEGVLDLRGFEFSNKKTLPLDGEWEFYPSVFLESEDAKDGISQQENKKYVQVPGSWSEAFENVETQDFYYGTYRLQIVVDDNTEHTFGIRTNRINSASEVFINGNSLEKMGQPAAEKEQFQAHNIPHNVVIIPENGKVDLLIHVANNFENGGIVRSIRFGTMDAINHRTTLSVGSQLLVVLVFSLHCFYALIIFFVGAARNKELLYFSLFGICAILAVLVADDILLLRWFTIDPKWLVLLTMLPYMGYSLLIPLLADSVFPTHRRKKSFKWAIIMSSLVIIWAMFTPNDLSKIVQILAFPIFFSFTVAALIYWDAEKEVDEAIFLLLSIITLIFDFAWTFFMHGQSMAIMHYPFNFILYVLLFTAFWFRRYVRINNEAKQLTEKLQREDKRKDRFLINTSHELRNPLHSIINIVQAIIDDKANPPSDEHKKRLEMLIVVGKRMAHMLNDLLDITRLKEKTIEMHLAKVHIEAAVEGVVDLLKLSIGGKPIRLQIEIPDSFPTVKADENRLTQILFNLVHNAVKYTDEGSITVRAKVINKTANISVEDTGIGIEENELSLIFQPYEQANINSTRASGGFGLGLSICKTLVELHGGVLTAHSTIGKGSTFTFTLPLYHDSEKDEENDFSFKNELIDTTAITSEDIYEDYSSNRKDDDKQSLKNAPKILVVDDDNINLNVMVQILKGEGYEITPVISAQEALDKLTTEQYDLVISDVMMPQMTGYKLTQIIREQYSISELPVLLLTARVLTEDVLAGFQAGANDYVQKPVDAWELKARVRALIDLKVSIEERLQIEGAWLQSQIQPHFIFNALNSIAALALVDINKMEELLAEFSNYLRLSIDFRNSDTVVPLKHELSIVQSYLYIEKERFKDRLHVQWEIDEDIDIKIPPLTIQPLVENAIMHGIMQGPRRGTVCIRIQNVDDTVEISVTDDGKGMSKERVNELFIIQESKRTSIGLQNINRRLKRLYGNELAIQSSPEKGTTISFIISNKYRNSKN